MRRADAGGSTPPPARCPLLLRYHNAASRHRGTIVQSTEIIARLADDTAAPAGRTSSVHIPAILLLAAYAKP